MCSNNYDNLGLWMMLLLSSIVLRKLGKTIGYSMSYYLYASSVLELLFAIRTLGDRGQWGENVKNHLYDQTMTIQSIRII